MRCGHDLRLHPRVDVLEMDIGNAVHVARHEGHGVEAGIVRMPGVEADLQQRRVDFSEQPLDLGLEIDEARGMRMNRDGEAIIFRAHARDVAEA